MEENNPIWAEESAPVRRAYLKAKSEGWITQQSLADQLDVSQGIVGRWINGKKRIPDDKMLMLAKILGFDAIEARPEIANLVRLVEQVIMRGGRGQLTEKILSLDEYDLRQLEEYLDFVISRRST